MSRYIVTGGAGFIGSHITETLVGQGHEVVVLDDLSTGYEHNLAAFRDKIEFIKGSITDEALLQKIMPGTDVVFHQGALASVPRSVAEPLASNDVNITGTLKVFIAAKEAGVRRVVYAASSSAYGDSETLPKREDMPGKPLSPYAVTKYVDELYGKVFTDIYDLPTVGLRYFNVFGPRQDPKSEYAAVIPLFIALYGGRGAADPWRRWAIPRLHLHRERGAGQPQGRGRGRQGRRPGLQCGLWREDRSGRTGREDSRAHR